MRTRKQTVRSKKSKPIHKSVKEDISLRERKQVKQILSDSEIRYRRLFESAKDGILILDAETGMIVDVNPFLIELLGFSHEQFLGKKIWELGFFKDIFANQAKFLELQQKKYIRYEDLPLETAEGRRINVEFVSNVYEADHHKVIQCNIRDITERKQVEKIRYSFSLLRATFDSTPDGILVVDQKGKVTNSNKRFLEMWRIPESLALTGEDKELLEYVYNQLKEPKVFLDGVEKLYTHPDAESYDLLEFKDGRLFERYSAPQTIGEKVVGRVWCFRNITERKEAEEKYRILFEETKDVIYISTHEGKILDINPAGVKTFGYQSEKEILKLNMEKDIYWNPEDRAKIKKLLQENGFIKDYELEMKRKDGEKLIMRLTTTAVKDKKGNIADCRVIARDITEQKRLGQQLIQSEKMGTLGELITGVAHEINNPLTAIIGFTEFLLKTNKDMDAEMSNDIQQIYDASMRVYNITKGLLRFARKEKPVKKDVYINDLLEEILKMKEYHLHVINIEIKKSYCQSLPLISGDANQLGQVFLNIINNAEYVLSDKHQGGILTTRTSLQDNYVKIEFIDTGPGIPENKINKIFDPFFTTKPQGKGTGLGLSVSYGIIQEHEGKIYAENSREGGAVFVILLPVKGKDGQEKNTDS